MSSFADYSKCESIELCRRYATAWRSVRAADLHAIGNPRFEVFHEFMQGRMDDLIFELRSCIYGRTLTKYPRDWWEAVKERWFPAWALKRWPVLYNRIDELYPELELPSAGPRVIRVDAWQPEETSKED